MPPSYHCGRRWSTVRTRQWSTIPFGALGREQASETSLFWPPDPKIPPSSPERAPVFIVQMYAGCIFVCATICFQLALCSGFLRTFALMQDGLLSLACRHLHRPHMRVHLLRVYGSTIGERNNAENSAATTPSAICNRQCARGTWQ